MASTRAVGSLLSQLGQQRLDRLGRSHPVALDEVGFWHAEVLHHELQAIGQAVAVRLVLGDALLHLCCKGGQIRGVEQFGNGMAEDVGDSGHRFVPVLQVGQRLLPELQFIRHVVEAGRVIAAVPHERTIRLIGVDQNQQVLHFLRQTPFIGLIGPPSQVRRPWDAVAPIEPACG